MLQKKDRFKGQKAIVLPQYIRQELDNNVIARLLHLTAIGYYPEAKYHFREGSSGAEENILIFCIAGKGCVRVNNIERRVKWKSCSRVIVQS